MRIFNIENEARELFFYLVRYSPCEIKLVDSIEGYPKALGLYRSKENLIEIKTGQTPKDMLNTLVHELLHYIQWTQYEGREIGLPVYASASRQAASYKVNYLQYCREKEAFMADYHYIKVAVVNYLFNSQQIAWSSLEYREPKYIVC